MTPDYKHIAPLRADNTPAEIAQALSCMLIKPILLADIENWLDFSNLAERDDTGWIGPLADTRTDPAIPQLIRDGVSDLFKHLNKTRATELHVNEAEYGVKAHSLLEGLSAFLISTDEHHAEFDALGGGHLYPDGVSEQEVADVIAAFDAAEAVQAAQGLKEQKYADAMNTHVNPVLANGSEADLVAGMRAAADAIEGV